MNSQDVRWSPSRDAPSPSAGSRRAPRGGAALLLAAVAAAALAGACSEISTSLTDRDSFEFRIGTEVPGATPSSVQQVAAEVVVDDGTRTLTVTQVEMAVREIQARRQGETCQLVPVGSTVDNDECAEFSAQTVLLELPVADGDSLLRAIRAPTGVYDQLQFKLNTLQQNQPGDFDILVDRGDFEGSSIRVVGEFDDGSGSGPQPFELFFDIDTSVEMDFPQPLDADVDERARATLISEVSTWFVRSTNGGTEVISPDAVANQQAVRDEVKANILDSFRATAELL